MLRADYEAREKGISQKDLAELTGINRVTINRILRGRETAWPKWRNAIADALEWESDPAELFEEIEVR